MITLEGLIYITNRHKQGLTLPNNWKIDVKEYIYHKRWAVNNLGGTQKMIQQRKDDLAKAEELIYYLFSNKGRIYEH